MVLTLTKFRKRLFGFFSRLIVKLKRKNPHNLTVFVFLNYSRLDGALNAFIQAFHMYCSGERHGGGLGRTRPPNYLQDGFSNSSKYDEKKCGVRLWQ
jgi:hypothetical protein